MDDVQMGIASDWVGLSLRRVLGFGERVHGENRPRILSTNKRIDDVQMGVASDWVGLSMRRVVGFGGRVRGEKKG